MSCVQFFACGRRGEGKWEEIVVGGNENMGIEVTTNNDKLYFVNNSDF